MKYLELGFWLFLEYTVLAIGASLLEPANLTYALWAAFVAWIAGLVSITFTATLENAGLPRFFGNLIDVSVMGAVLFWAL